MRINLVIIFILILYIPSRISYAQGDSISFPVLTENAQISLITGEPGKELYAVFGHSAIRVNDPENGIDLVYNYGTFDFDAPGFYPKFLMGKLNYFLSVYEFKRMVYAYKYYNQSLYEQILDINYDEKVALYNFINNNYLPENRYYLYDFFFDNCSSRIRDVLEIVLGDKLYFDDQHIKNPKTFRQLLDEFLVHSKWEDFGIDLIIGRPADVTASTREYMFLPYKLFDAFEYAEIVRGEDKSPLVNATITIHQSVKIPDNGTIQISPLLVFWTLFMIVLGLSLILNQNKQVFKYIDVIIFSAIGLTGVLIFFLWFVTDHITTKDNLNILWAFPIHFILPIIILKNKKAIWIKYYLQFWMIFLILFLASWSILPQQLHIANIPLILILIVRFFYNSKTNNSKDVERRK